MRRKVKETIQMVVMGVLLGAGVMASFLFFGLRAKAAPAPNDLVTIERHEIADMLNREEWHAWVNPLSPYEMDLLAALIWSEAGDQRPLFEGLCWVCDVVLNRVDSPAWPGSIESVIYQSGQFSVVSNGALARAYGNAPQICYDAIISQLQDRWDYQIQFFSQGYLANGTLAFVHGSHYYSY